VGSLDKLTHDKVLKLVMFIGTLLLENGLGTTQVEDAMLWVCYHFGIKDINVFVTPTFIILGDDSEVGKNLIHRVKFRGRNLSVLCAVNKFIHKLDKWELSFEETLEYLEKAKAQPYKSGAVCLFSGIGAAFFALLMGGSVFDFFGAFVTGMVAMIVTKMLNIGEYSSFWENCISGVAMGLLALAVCKICPKCNLEMVTVGALMPFLPGLAFTNGLNDAISGDLISGNSRITEAIMLALALVIGLGSTLIIALQGQGL